MMRDNSNEIKACKDLSDAVNNCCFNKDAFVEQFEKEHRYLQGEMFDLLLRVIKACAKDDYGYDGRNEFVHKISKEIVANNPQYF